MLTSYQFDHRASAPATLGRGPSVALVALAVLRRCRGLLPTIGGARPSDIGLVGGESPLVVAADVALVVARSHEFSLLSRHHNSL
jgi:hypothetical protein